MAWERKDPHPWGPVLWAQLDSNQRPLPCKRTSETVYWVYKIYTISSQIARSYEQFNLIDDLTDWKKVKNYGVLIIR
jgi:hypothetical protein